MTIDDANRPVLLGPVTSIRLFCRDLAAARDFYGGLLRLPEVAATADWLVFDLGTLQLIVEPVAEDDDEGAEMVGRFTAFSFSVDDAERVCDHLAAAGVEIVGRPERQPWGGTLAHLKDPSGNVLTLVQAPA